MKIQRIVAALVGALTLGIAFSASAGPRDPDACPLACEQDYYTCVVNQVGTEHECYMDFHYCVYACPPF